MSFRKMISIGLGFFALSVILIGAHSLSNTSANSAELHANQAPYSVDGPFQVVVRTQEISAKTSLEIMVWYPGLANTTDNTFSYDYEIKMQEPLGRVAIATYEGHAVIDAQFDHSMAPYPFVILSPGFSIGASSYGWLAEHLASYGFVVISPDQSWDRTYAHGLIQHFTTAFLLAVLKHDADAATFLAQDNIDFKGVDYQREK